MKKKKNIDAYRAGQLIRIESSLSRLLLLLLQLLLLRMVMMISGTGCVGIACIIARLLLIHLNVSLIRRGIGLAHSSVGVVFARMHFLFTLK